MADDDFAVRHLTPPTQCVLWHDPEKFHRRGLLETVETYDEDSHEGAYLLKCNECGQLYHYRWYEVVDWEHGKDRIYDTAVPVRTAEEIAEVRSADAGTILRFVPILLDERWHRR